MMDVLEGRIGLYGHVLEMNRKEDPRKALNMRLNENAQSEGLIPRREHQVRTEMYCRRKV